MIWLQASQFTVFNDTSDRVCIGKKGPIAQLHVSVFCCGTGLLWGARRFRGVGCHIPYKYLLKQGYFITELRIKYFGVFGCGGEFVFLIFIFRPSKGIPIWTTTIVPVGVEFKTSSRRRDAALGNKAFTCIPSQIRDSIFSGELTVMSSILVHMPPR